MNLKRANNNNSKTIYSIYCDLPKIVIIIAIIILVATLITILPTCDYMPEIGALIFLCVAGVEAIILVPFFIRCRKAYINITDTSIIVKDWFFVTYQKSYRLDTITNVEVTSFFGFNTLIIDFTQGDALKSKKLIFNLSSVCLKISKFSRISFALFVYFKIFKYNSISSGSFVLPI